MENLYNYIKSVALSIEGVEQVEYINSETKLDELKERRYTFVGVVFGDITNNSNFNEVIDTSIIFENKCDVEGTLYLKQMDVLKRIISEFKNETQRSNYIFPQEWTLNPFNNLSVDATIGYRIDLEIINPNKRFCANLKN